MRRSGRGFIGGFGGIKGGLVLAAMAMLPGSVTVALAQSAATGQSPEDALPASHAVPTPVAAPSAAEVRAHKAWSAAMDAKPAPDHGCFKAVYPNPDWIEVPCLPPLNRPFGQPHSLHSNKVGGGNDMMAETSQMTKVAYGELPVVQGVTSVTGPGGEADAYSLQVNSNFMNTAACKSSTSGNCKTWQQFVYSSHEGLLFMQYWLVGYGAGCPTGWMANGRVNCYKNSGVVQVPLIPATQLQGLKLQGTAVAGGNDRVTFYTPASIYTMVGADNIVDLATQWKDTEFNVFGDGGSLVSATFNTGSSVTVQIALFDGTRTAPTCVGGGTTAETNNLTINSCRPFGGAPLLVKIKESN